MGRIIINNRSELDDKVAMDMVLTTMSKGRLSNNGKQYAYLCCYKYGGKQYDVASDLRKGSDSFVVYYSPYNDKNFKPQ